MSPMLSSLLMEREKVFLRLGKNNDFVWKKRLLAPSKDWELPPFKPSKYWLVAQTLPKKHHFLAIRKTSSDPLKQEILDASCENPQKISKNRNFCDPITFSLQFSSLRRLEVNVTETAMKFYIITMSKCRRRRFKSFIEHFSIF